MFVTLAARHNWPLTVVLAQPTQFITELLAYHEAVELERADPTIDIQTKHRQRAHMLVQRSRPSAA